MQVEIILAIFENMIIDDFVNCSRARFFD